VDGLLPRCSVQITFSVSASVSASNACNARCSPALAAEVMSTVLPHTTGDGGKTWSFPRVLLDSPIDDRDAGVLETAKGSLLATTFTSNAYDERIIKVGAPKKWATEKQARWLAAHNRVPAADRKKELGTWMIRSTDGGVTC
jgi:hypothetical protein